MKIIKQHDYPTNPESVIVKCDLKSVWLITPKDVYTDNKDGFRTCGYTFSVILIPEEFGYYDKGKPVFSERIKQTDLWKPLSIYLNYDKTEIVFY